MRTYADMFNGEQQLVPGTLRGFRTWEVVLPEALLASTGVSNVWGTDYPSQMPYPDPAARLGDVVEQARCLVNGGTPCGCPLCVTMQVPDGHDAPLAECRCGIYGWYQPSDTRIVEAPVFGAIAASGRTILGAHGFRAQRARVLALASTGDTHVDRRLIERGYRVLPLRDDVIELYPPEDVSALVLHECDEQCARISAQRARRVIISTSGYSVSLDELRRMLGVSTPVFQAGSVATWAQANPALPSPALPSPEESRRRERALRLKQERNAGARPWLPASLWRRAAGL